MIQLWDLIFIEKENNIHLHGILHIIFIVGDLEVEKYERGRL